MVALGEMTGQLSRARLTVAANVIGEAQGFFRQWLQEKGRSVKPPCAKVAIREEEDPERFDGLS